MSNTPLSRDDGRVLLAVARERIASTLEQREPRYPEPTPALRRSGGAFCTLHLDQGGRLILRGCIGQIDSSDELVETVRNNVTIDWTLRENVRAHLRVLVKRILRKHGYPPDKQEKATRTVLEQAEALSEAWAMA